MSAFTLEAARSERATAIHQNTGIRLLHHYVKYAQRDGLEDSGFVVSGDMLAMIRRAGRGPLERRRRRAARVWYDHEGVA